MFKNNYKKERDELYDILKAIINKFGVGEIVISRDEIRRTKQAKIYVSRELLRDAKKYKLIWEENILSSYKEDR